MEKRLIITIVVSLVVIAGFVLLLTGRNAAEVESDEGIALVEQAEVITELETEIESETESEPEIEIVVVPQVKTVEMSSSGFFPKTLEINVSTKVRFITIDSGSYWPASANHPSHTIYPGSGIDKCGSSEEVNIFDSCKKISSGEVYEFTFNEIGTWNYHNHFNSGMRGTIIVK